MFQFITRRLTESQKQFLRGYHFKFKLALIRRFRSYSASELEDRFRRLGLAEGDTVMSHGSFSIYNGFQGEAQQIIDCLLGILGPEGNLLMTSMAYAGSAYDYLKEGKPFEVRKTISRMGILTEIFRRRRGVLRSLNPVHPILAFGPMASWMVEGHEKTMLSAGPDSPFAKFLSLRGKILFFDADFLTCTFLHYLEDRFKQLLPVKVYHDEILDGVLFDAAGGQVPFKTHVFSPQTVKARDALWLVLKQELIRTGKLKNDKIGNSRLLLVGAQDLVDQAEELSEEWKLSRPPRSL